MSLIVALRARTADIALVNAHSLADPSIEIANQSGVSGYSIGIFGTNFGVLEGNVEILGAPAQIEEWSDTFVKVTVPSVTPGTGNLRLETFEELSTTNLFQVYTINPLFQGPPAATFRNIAFGKPVSLTNLTNTFCYRQPENTYTEAVDFLTDYRCGYSGITGDGHATFSVDGNGAIIAVDLLESVTGTFYFQFFNSSGWYVDQSAAPKNYVIEVSADSTDGFNGSWQALHSEVDNNRAFRLHKIVVPTGGARWVRLRVTSTNQAESLFDMKEIRLYQPSNNSQSNLDIFALYGDSITKDANEVIGHVGLAQKIQERSNGVEDLILSIYGLSGQNTSGLVDQTDVDFDIYDAFALDNVGSTARYWGIALGTNDSNDSIDLSNEPWSNIGAYDERLDAIIQEIIGRGAVPIVARIPDTDEPQGGFGTLATKKKILADIDRLTAQYQLIPGPDFYTAFRTNIDNDGSTWVRSGDGTHHSNEGRLAYLELWSEAFVKGTNRADFVTLPTPTNTPLPTSTPLPTNTPLLTNIPLPTGTSTGTKTPLFTATPTPTGTLTPSFDATATPTNVLTTSPTPLSGTAIPTIQPSATAINQSTPVPGTVTLVPTPVLPGGDGTAYRIYLSLIH